MTQIEQIKAEIERLKEIGCPLQKGSDYQHGYDEFYTQIKTFINSLPAEQSEDLDIDEELQRFFETKHLFVDADDLQTVRHCNGSPTDKTYYFEDVARHFAHLQKEQMMKSAIEVKINRDTLYNLKPIIHEKYQDLKIGDKILIIKEDEQ